MNYRTRCFTGIAAVFVALAAAVTLPAQQRSTISRAEFTTRADSLVNAYLASSLAPSAAVAVIRGNDTLVFKGYGLANIPASRPATPTTVYEIGSITKQFTSSAIMRLVEAGRINLDDDLSKYVPQFPLQGQRVSIRQLLTHTSGIHNYTLSPEWRKTWAEDLTPDAIVAFVAKDTLDFAPGAAYRYSNTGYVLLGMVIEKVTGQRYADHLDAVFFKPLGMRQTSYCPSKTSDPAFATGYSRSPDRKVIPMTYLSLTQPFSAGGLCSTVGDLVTWQRALASGKAVSPTSFTRMTTAGTLNNGSPIRYGFGLVPGNVLGHATVSHGGGINGFAAASLFVPADSLNIAVFTNIDAEPADPLASNLLRVAYGAAPVAPRPPIVGPQALPDAVRDAILGTYVLQVPGGDRSPIKFFLDGGRVMAQRDGQPANALTYLGNFQFGIAADPSLRVTFFRDGAGLMGKVTLLQGGATTEGVRAP
jgi:D-alanyl-D-alanine carboxypeptidase